MFCNDGDPVSSFALQWLLAQVASIALNKNLFFWPVAVEFECLTSPVSSCEVGTLFEGVQYSTREKLLLLNK